MRRIFITGGTGFIGRALVKKLLAAPETSLITCLTRSEEPVFFGDSRVEYLVGDIAEVEFPKAFYTDLIHAAADANDLLVPDAHKYYYSIVEGANRVFEWANAQRVSNVLFVSSGVVKRDTVYGRAKRQSEMIASHLRVSPKIARLHSVVGEEMPMNGQYALGKFIHQAVVNNEIRYWGGNSVRSYLYIEDVADWLIAVLNKGHQNKSYDVGGTKPIHISDLAHLVGELAGVPVFKIEQEGICNTYLPDAKKTMELLGVKETISLEESIRRTLAHVRNTHLEQVTEPTPYHLFDSGSGLHSAR